jgi:hypothetical protein
MCRLATLVGRLKMKKPRVEAGEDLTIPVRGALRRYCRGEEEKTMLVMRSWWDEEDQCCYYTLADDGLTVTINDNYIDEYPTNNRAKELLEDEY